RPALRRPYRWLRIILLTDRRTDAQQYEQLTVMSVLVIATSRPGPARAPVSFSLVRSAAIGWRGATSQAPDSPGRRRVRSIDDSTSPAVVCRGQNRGHDPVVRSGGAAELCAALDCV